MRNEEFAEREEAGLDEPEFWRRQRLFLSEVTR